MTFVPFLMVVFLPSLSCGWVGTGVIPVLYIYYLGTFSRCYWSPLGACQLNNTFVVV
jgi:hypothetical protein